MAIYVEGCEDAHEKSLLATVLDRLNLSAPGEVVACFASCPYIRFRLESDPTTPVGEVLIWAEPEQES
jgi:hypothetical protein